jgi:hypothetical protein
MSGADDKRIDQIVADSREALEKYQSLLWPKERELYRELLICIEVLRSQLATAQEERDKLHARYNKDLLKERTRRKDLIKMCRSGAQELRETWPEMDKLRTERDALRARLRAVEELIANIRADIDAGIAEETLSGNEIKKNIWLAQLSVCNTIEAALSSPAEEKRETCVWALRPGDKIGRGKVYYIGCKGENWVIPDNIGLPEVCPRCELPIVERTV